MTEKEFASDWIKKLMSGMLKSFPENFMDSVEVKDFNLPGIDLILGEELFGNYDLLDTRRNSVLMVDDYYTAKYIIYSNRNKPSRISIPVNADEIPGIVKAYEAHLDSLLKTIEVDYSKVFPKAKNHHGTINEIFHHLNIKRI